MSKKTLHKIFEEEFARAAKPPEDIGDIYGAEDVKKIVQRINDDGFFVAKIGADWMNVIRGIFTIRLWTKDSDQPERIELYEERTESDQNGVLFRISLMGAAKFDISKEQGREAIAEEIIREMARKTAKRQYEKAMAQQLEQAYRWHFAKPK